MGQEIARVVRNSVSNANRVEVERSLGLFLC